MQGLLYSRKCKSIMSIMITVEPLYNAPHYKARVLIAQVTHEAREEDKNLTILRLFFFILSPFLDRKWLFHL